MIFIEKDANKDTIEVKLSGDAQTIRVEAVYLLAEIYSSARGKTNKEVADGYIDAIFEVAKQIIEEENLEEKES